MNACHCTPADHDYELRRDILPQRPALVDENLARQLFAGSYPSVYFGRGLSIDALSRTNNFEEIANMMRDPGWDKPFDQVRVGNDHKILVKVNWPDHDPLDTAHGEYVPLEAANRPGIPSTKAQLALLVGQVVMRAMERVKNNRPGDHRCWAVSTNEEDGLTKRCVYLYAIHHVGGFTYQPELQVAPSRPPRLFPAIIRPQTCGCTRTTWVAATGMYLLPQTSATTTKAKAEEFHKGFFPSVYFGRRGIDMRALTVENRTDTIPDGLATPFQTFFGRFPETKKIKVRVQWPNHEKGRMGVAQDVQLLTKTGHITSIELARAVGGIVRKAMDKCYADRLESPPDHRCWGMATVKKYGLTKECIYLVSLHHVAGITYQPELHIAPSMQPHLFPTFREATYKELVEAPSPKVQVADLTLSCVV